MNKVRRKLKKPKYVESEEDSSVSQESDVELETNKKTTTKQTAAKKTTKTNKKKKYDTDDEDEDFLPDEESSITSELSDEEKNVSECSQDESTKPEKTLTQKKRKRNNSKSTNNLNGMAVKEKENTKESSITEANSKEKMTKSSRKEKFILDPKFNLEESYFYQDVSKSQWDQIRIFIMNYLKDNKTDNSILKDFFQNYPNLKKGEHNMNQLRKIIDNQFATFTISDNSFKSYKTLNDFIINEYFSYKASLFECFFFPSVDNEIHVVNILRTCKKTLDIAIYTLTNERIFAAIEEVYKRGVKVRIITDDECCKMAGSEIARCAAIGIPTKTDDSARANMHHKFAVIDNSVVITGSFNWTNQAVKINQENILFYENKELAAKYTEEYNRLWNLFTTVVDPKISILKVKEEDERMRKKLEEKEKEKENKKKEKEKEKENKKKEKELDKENKKKVVSSQRERSQPLKTVNKENEITSAESKKGGCVIF